MKYLPIIFIFISQPIFAEEYLRKNECDKNQRAMNICAKEMFEFYDNNLNITYKKVMKVLTPSKKNQLRSQQRVWLKNRDPDCRNDANEEAEGGSMWPMIYNGCRAESTKQRTTIISKWLKLKNEYRIYPSGKKSGPKHIALSCSKGNINIVFKWYIRVGDAGKYRRHMFILGDLGDTHFLLKTLSNETSTGIINNDKQAKSLIQLILKHSVKGYRMPIQVFPQDSDPYTGEWENAFYSPTQFKETVKIVAKECNWNNEHYNVPIRTVRPGAEYEGG